MTFFDPTPPALHRCPLPAVRMQNGWRCQCGKAYIVEALGPRDTNQGEPPWQWRRAMQYDVAALSTEDDE
jgi:hypothetical protein